MNKCLLVLLLFGASTSVFAQKNLDDSNPRGKLLYTLFGHVDSLFRQGRFSGKCGSGYLFVKFVMKKRGQIVSFETNDGTPDYLDSVISKILPVAVKGWQPPVPLKSKGTTFLLPIMYEMGRCEGELVIGKKPTIDELLAQMPALGENIKDGKFYSFLHMIRFDKTDYALSPDPYSFLEGVILPTFMFYRPLHQ